MDEQMTGQQAAACCPVCVCEERRAGATEPIPAIRSGNSRIDPPTDS
ncbi:hypothetical protein [Paenibacillus oceani]|uniref:Uncharacterized protein n=1 Tax=Paenibacillus oceani TaxID=2772510 RepID=A0A927C8B1_9BACL|nr:hypothetical protein [Paenibacillus oceani]MBD2861953.1 hypothetical protein [Paenibacillus oceani]